MKFVLRFLSLAAVLGWYLAKYALGWLRCLLLTQGKVRQGAISALRGRILREALSTLGATFVKLGQIASTRPDLLPPEIIDELCLLQDRMPPFEARLALRTIEEDLGRGALERFAEFDQVPVAAASVAQVHRARLRDGSEVAVKVLRPKVREQV